MAAVGPHRDGNIFCNCSYRPESKDTAAAATLEESLFFWRRRRTRLSREFQVVTPEY